ncbi:hypothetical protein LTR17_012037 [Elasticomyces elasticus]|nr:hypothetical protein LTR17_012037 [Elasticomyces elasticus]
MVSYETCRRLLSNHDILERVLLHLPLRQLLLCKILCRHARDTIQQSQQIRRALFLEPAVAGTISWSATEGHWVSPDGTCRAHNQDYSAIPPAIIVGALRITGHHTKHVPLSLDCNLDAWHGGGGLTWCVGNRPVGPGISPSRLQTLVREGAPSLALMLMTQPPCSGVTLSGIAPRTGLKETLQADSGIRLGEFMGRATVVAFYHSERAEAVTGHEEWRLTERSTDEMTGWDMSQLLKASPNGVVDSRTTKPPTDLLPGTPLPAISAAKVLGIYELLETILLHLPLRRLLLCQRVNRAFKDVVNRSAPIRKSLFLEPACSDTIDTVMQPIVSNPQPRYRPVWKTLVTAEQVLPVLNPFAPLLKHGLYSSTFSPRKEGAGSLAVEASVPRAISGLGSTVPSTLDRFQCHFASVDGTIRWSATQISPDGSGSPETSLGGKESLQRMLVIHPPARGMRLERANSKPLPSGLSDARSQPPDNKVWQGKLNQIGDPTNIDGVRFREFVKAATNIAALVSGKKSASEICIVGGHWIRPCPKSVDKMTGWEMLRFFEVGERRFFAEQRMGESNRSV